MMSIKHLKGTLAILLVSTTVLGLLVLKSSDVFTPYLSQGYNEGHVKVYVGEKQDLFKLPHRKALEILGSKVDEYMDEDVESTMRRRREHVEAVCSLLENNDFNKKLADRQLTYYEHTKTLYCPVAKVASKFLARMLYVLNYDNYESPFDFKGAPLNFLSKMTKSMSEPERKVYIDKVKNNSLSFVFTRNPYKRIFSSYMDKFFSPNSLYWNYAQRRVRKEETGCGKNLRFSELVRFLISTNPESYDAHFKPVSLTCDVCKVKYDVIGKIETFKTDVYHIMNVTSDQRSMFKDFAQENSIHYIIFNSKRTYGMLRSLLRCSTHHNIYLRLWRQLQISGMIERDHKYPLTPEESITLNLTTLTNLLLDGYHRSTSGARSNSRDAYLQAYSEVPLEDLEKLRLKYLKDFILFDYESRPSDIFVRKDSVSNRIGAFDFFDSLEET